jgi:hypothetical protein
MGMISSIKITESDWQKLKSRITDDYGAKIFMIRNRCRQTLGFTIRYNDEWIRGDHGRWNMHHNIYLDFFDEPLQTMFFLRYSDIIDYM